MYLPKRIEGGGPCDGSAPSSVAKILRRQEVGVLYPEIEEQLLSVELSHPRGDEEICRENNDKWRAVLNGFLVDAATMEAINGGNLWCS